MALNLISFFSPPDNPDQVADFLKQFDLLTRSGALALPSSPVFLMTPRWAKLPLPEVRLKRFDPGQPGLMAEKVQSWRDACLAADIKGDILLLDPDILIVGKIDEPFVFPAYDVGLTWHPDSTLRHPINAGVLFVPAPGRPAAAGFFDACLRDVGQMDDAFRQWYGDQQALVNLCGVDHVSGRTLPVGRRVGDARVRFFDWKTWNRWPDEDAPIIDLAAGGARIVHFKGKRKSAMHDYFERFVDRPQTT